MLTHRCIQRQTSTHTQMAGVHIAVYHSLSVSRVQMPVDVRGVAARLVPSTSACTRFLNSTALLSTMKVLNSNAQFASGNTPKKKSFPSHLLYIFLSLS